MKAPEKDDLYLEIIRRVARGEETPWRLDERYQMHGPPEERYKNERSDKQALLWEIYLAAESGKPIPEWAATEFKQIMRRLFRGGLPDWETAFGTTLARKKNRKGPDYKRGVQARTMQKRAAIMVPLWRHAQELKRKGRSVNDDLFDDLAKEFDIKFDEAKDLYTEMNNWMKKHLPHHIVPGPRG